MAAWRCKQLGKTQRNWGLKQHISSDFWIGKSGKSYVFNQSQNMMSWLVVYLPLWKIWVRQWEGLYPIYEMENKTCLKPPIRKWLLIFFWRCWRFFLSNLTDNDYSDMIWRIPSYLYIYIWIYTYIHIYIYIRIYIYIYILKLFDAIVYYGVFT